MLIESLWQLFVSGPMQIIRGINHIFSNQFSGIDSITVNFIYSLIVYALFTLLGIVVSLITIFISRVSAKINKNFNVITTKNLFFCLLVIVIFPGVLFVISLFFNYFIPLILSSISDTPYGQIGDEFFKSLYNIGNNTNILLDFPSNNSFSPPVSLQNWNVYVQIAVVNIIMWSLIYLLWNYTQKIIEIFILSITLPASSFIKNSNNEIGIILWLKEIWNKFIVCIFSIICFYLYFLSIQTIINTIAKIEYLSKFVLSFFISISLFVTIIILVNVFNQKNKQYRGIIKSINSLKDTIVFNFKTIQDKLVIKSSNNENDDNIIDFQNRINNLKKSSKPTIIDKNNEIKSLKNTTIY